MKKNLKDFVGRVGPSFVMIAMNPVGAQGFTPLNHLNWCTG
jgi:hypothetical protein